MFLTKKNASNWYTSLWTTRAEDVVLVEIRNVEQKINHKLLSNIYCKFETWCAHLPFIVVSVIRNISNFSCLASTFALGKRRSMAAIQLWNLVVRFNKRAKVLWKNGSVHKKKVPVRGFGVLVRCGINFQRSVPTMNKNTRFRTSAGLSFKC